MSFGELSVDDLLHAIPDPFCVLDEDFRFAFVNEPAVELLRAPPHDLLGESLWERYPRAGSDPARREVERAMRDRRSVELTTFDAQLQRWFSIRALPYRNGLAVFFHDVTAVKRAEERWERIAEIRAALHRIAAQVAAGAPPEDTYEVVCAESARLVGAAGSWLLRFSGRSYCVLARAVPEACARRQDMPGTEHRVSARGDLGRMLETSASVVVPDRLSGTLARHGLRAAILVPIRLGGTVWGALVVGWSAPRSDAHEALPWLEELTQLVSAGLSSAAARAELARRAATDALTGLANRRVLDEQLAHSVARAERHDLPFTLALFDVDEFKAVNDTYGHEVGDAVLCVMAGELSAASRDEDLAVRVGGDEFALLLDGSDAQASLAVVERLRHAIAAALLERELPAGTVSAGVAAWRPGSSPAALLRDADAALYAAKRGGRDAARVHAAPAAGATGVRVAAPDGHAAG